MRSRHIISKDRYKSVLNSEGESDGASVTEGEIESIISSPNNLIALDCEMVGVGKYKHDALARCSIVDYFGNIIYDQYIKPKVQITDYRTRWSGILPQHMVNAIPFKVARKQILKIIKSKIIVGHSLHFDFKILKIRKESDHIRDTSKNLELRRLAGFPTNETPSLKRLSQVVLGREIQTDSHCSVEDSIAAMDLYRAVETEWNNISNKKRSKYLSDAFWPSWLKLNEE